MFDAGEAVSRAREVRKGLQVPGFPAPVQFVYSIKATPFLIEPLIPVVDALEVCSPGELAICRELGVPGEKIIYSGVNKGAEDVRDALGAVDESVRIVTIESPRHFQLVRSAVQETGVRVDVILRLSAKNQFGMSKEDARVILAEAAKEDQIRVTGLHYFAGTARKRKHRQEEIGMLAGLLDELKGKFAGDLPFLEYGPGLGYPYFSDEDFSDTMAPLSELAEDLAPLAGKCELSVEMGRFLASSCGTYLTGVADLKCADDHRWCILDGGINHVNYLGQIMGLKQPVIRNLSANKLFGTVQSGPDHWTLCGSLCTANDVLVRDFGANDLQIGDVLAFEHIGAYSVTEGLYLFLSRDLPAVVMRDEDGSVRKLRGHEPTWTLNTKNLEV